MGVKSLRILLIIATTILIALIIVDVVLTLTPPSTTPEQSPETEEKGVIDMTYTFEGVHADIPGFAQGTITLTPCDDSAALEGYYLLYFADENGLLAGYDELASLPITGETVSYTVPKAVLLPPEATALAVFESHERFLDKQPSFDKRAALLRLPTEKMWIPSAPEYTFGAVADVHMNYEAHNRGAYQKWENTLNYFAAQGMDDIVVAGDMTGDENEGTLAAQYQIYCSIIEASDYPSNHIFECIGNHGNTEQGRLQFTQYTSGTEEDHPFEGSPWFSVLRKGVTRDNLFIFMAQELKAPGDSANYDNFSKEQIDWVESLLKTYNNTETNIFIVEHSPFLNYGPGDRHPRGGYTGMVTFKSYYLQSMRLKKLLERYRDVILMSGHTHLSLYDGENYSDEDGTSCRMIHIGSNCQPCSYGTGEKLIRSTDGRHDVSPTYGSEAYTVSVYSDRIVYIGRNLSTDTIIPSACFVLPIHTEG